MGSKIIQVASGIGILIGIYLFLSRGKETTSIINSLAYNTTQGIKTLQGR